MTNLPENETAPTPKDLGEAPRVPAVLPYPCLWQAIVLLFLFLLMQTVVGVLFVVFGGSMNDLIFAAGIGNLTAWLIVAGFGLWRAKRPFREVFPFSSFPISILVPLVVCVSGMHILLSEADNLTRWLIGTPEFAKQLARALSEGGIFATITLVVIAPLTEETLFRGLILGGFLLRYSVRRSIFVSSALFGLVHLNPSQLLPAFVLGLLFGWLFVETGSLFTCMIAHAVANGSISISLWAADNFGFHIPGYTTGMGGEAQFQPIWFDGLGILLMVAGLWGLKRMLGRRTENPPH